MKVFKIVFLGIGIFIIVAIIVAILVFTMLNKSNSKVNEPNEVVYKGTSDKKALVVYQPSKGDTTENISTAAAKQLNGEGYTVVVNYPSEKLTYNLQDYDIIAFGTPVYMGQTSGTLTDYIKKNKFTGKKVLLYTTGSNTEAMDEVNKMEENLEKGNKVAKIKVSKEQEDKIKEFITSFVIK